MKNYVLVGTGNRGQGMFVRGIHKDGLDKECAKITGLFDINMTRCRAVYNNMENKDGVTVYSDFDEMLDRENPTAVIVASTDNTHAPYIIRALDRGFDVISEKPICNTYEHCKAIRDAEKRNNRYVTVTFNMRFDPVVMKIKELLSKNTIGKIYSVTYNYTLNRWHGGDYFKRWHRFMEISQGMLLHKSTHHFDAITWMIDDEPQRVMAMGNRMYYGDESRSFGPRCSACSRATECETFKSQSEKDDKALYFDAEHEDGYIRDRCAFLPDTDIYDNMSVSVQYKGGAILTYSLNLFSMREGYTMVISGERGNIIASYYKHNVAADDMEDKDADIIRVMKREAESEIIRIPRGSTAHNGSDQNLRAMLFDPEHNEDTLGQMADSFAGFTSAMIGIAANKSIKTGESVDVEALLDTLR